MSARADRFLPSLVPELARAKPLSLRPEPQCTPWANLSNGQKKALFEQLLVAAGFPPNERNCTEIADKLGWSRNTLKGWRDPRDLTRAPSDKAFERLADYIEMHRLLAEFGRTG